MAIIGKLAQQDTGIKIGVRLTRQDLILLEDEAREHDMVIGYWLDLLVAAEANRLRLKLGQQPEPTPFLAPDDSWRNATVTKRLNP